jgi:hypothetical protein
MRDEGGGVFMPLLRKKAAFWGVTNRLIPKKSEILVENWGQV